MENTINAITATLAGFTGVDVGSILAKFEELSKKTKKFYKVAEKSLGMTEDALKLYDKDAIVKMLTFKAAEREFYKGEARVAIGNDFGRAERWYKNMNNVTNMTAGDYQQLVTDWSVLQSLHLCDAVDDIDTAVAELMRINHCTTDTSNWTIEDKTAYVKEAVDGFVTSVFTETLTKEQTVVTKMGFNDLMFTNDGIVFDSSKAAEYTADKVEGQQGATIRKVGSAEDGISRMLETAGENGERLEAIVVFMGETAKTEDEVAHLQEQKRKVFKEGFTDVSTGKHFMFAFQNPSSCRKANFMFVEAKDWNDVVALWCKITGFNHIEELTNPAAALVDDKGGVVMAKLLARLSTRGSNSFNVAERAKPEWAEKIKNAHIEYTRDVEAFIDRPYKTMTAPGVMELVTGQKRKITPGDGQMIGSFLFHALIAVALRIISEDEYHEFCKLWDECGRNAMLVDPKSRLAMLIAKIPSVFQLRHGEKKGICVRYNMEAIPQLANVDAIVPDSVRKFTSGEWDQFPLEICNWLKRKDSWVALNPQIIQALDWENPNALKPIVDYWLDFMEDSLTDIAKAQQFHGLIRSSDEDDNAADQSVSTLVHALRTNEKLLNEAQVCNWRRAQYEKFISDMKIGRILVPGEYTYMVCDPAYLLNQTFGLNLPCLKGGENGEDGEYYFNGKDADLGLFRSPLIHPFEAQHLKATNRPEYWYYRDVIVFNGYDGAWDRMGGGDFDGDTAAAVTNDDKYGFGQIIIDGIRKLPFDVWEQAQKAKKVIFKNEDGSINFDNLVEHLVTSAKVDRTGVITNYASKALDLSNHFKAMVYFAKLMGAQDITLLHPQQFGNDASNGQFGSKYPGRVCTRQDGTKTFVAKGMVLATTKRKGEVVFDNETAFYGTFTFDQVLAKANDYMYLVEILRLLQGREIDGAKTGVYAEGVSGNDFIDAVKVQFTPHEMIVRQTTLNRPVSKNALLNEYHSLSPLARMHDYVVQEVETKGRILSHLENGINMSMALYMLLTEEEKAFFKKTWIGNSRTPKNLLDIMRERKTAYNYKLYKLNSENSGDDGNNETIAAIKEKEREGIMAVAAYIGAPMEVMAVAAYMAAYNKDSKQNTGLTYGWILSAELLSVFSRGDAQYQMLRLPIKETKDVEIIDGIMYIDGRKHMAVNAYDGKVALKVVDGAICALVHRKVSQVVAPTNDIVATQNQLFCIGTSGFKYHIGKTMSGTVEDMKTMWKSVVKASGFQFDVNMDRDNRVVLSINGESISALMQSNLDMSCYALIGKRVQVVNGAIVNGETLAPITETAATIGNLYVVIVGNATPLK